MKFVDNAPKRNESEQNLFFRLRTRYLTSTPSQTQPIAAQHVTSGVRRHSAKAKKRTFDVGRQRRRRPFDQIERKLRVRRRGSDSYIDGEHDRTDPPELAQRAATEQFG